MLLDSWSQIDIVEAIKEDSFPADILASTECWKVICRVKAGNSALIDAEEWRELCATRGYIRSRQNSRGF